MSVEISFGFPVRVSALPAALFLISSLPVFGQSGASSDARTGPFDSSFEHPATSVTLAGPSFVAADGNGNVYFADNDATIYRVDKAGNLTLFAGTGTAGFSGDGGPPQVPGSSYRGIAADPAGNVYVADWWNNRIRKKTPVVLSQPLPGAAAPSLAIYRRYRPATTAPLQVLR